ncbi:MAG: hypothetical protein Kow0069_21560 [Promethearchaeota archaeon]
MALAKGRARRLHEDLHDLECPLSHQLSHLASHFVALAGLLLVENPGAVRSRELEGELENLFDANLARLRDALNALSLDAERRGDDPMKRMALAFSTALEFVESTFHRPEDARGLAEAMKRELVALTPLARSDLAAFHLHACLRRVLEAWGKVDGDLALTFRFSAHHHHHDAQKN